MRRSTRSPPSMGLAVIEDGAQSFGATQNGRRSGGVTLIGSTSFFPAKPLGCYGDGGALFTSDDKLAEGMKAVRNHGGLVRHHHTCVGMNGRFDTLQAAILLAKLPSFEWEVSQRNRIGASIPSYFKDTSMFQKWPKGIPTSTLSIRLVLMIGMDWPTFEILGDPFSRLLSKVLHEQPVYESLGYRWGQFSKCRESFQTRNQLAHASLPNDGRTRQDRISCDRLRAIQIGSSSFNR